mmetsp:Transcript_4109/g.5755  ORF Transcript_4109/g.5755 Transcript_4109/m.5755 type:complete len:136 (-) Transcript_4109:100-507(-)
MFIKSSRNILLCLQGLQLILSIPAILWLGAHNELDFAIYGLFLLSFMAIHFTISDQVHRIQQLSKVFVPLAMISFTLTNAFVTFFFEILNDSCVDEACLSLKASQLSMVFLCSAVSGTHGLLSVSIWWLGRKLAA